MELLREHFYDIDLFAPMKRIHAEGALAMRDNKADRIGACVNVKGIAADLTGYSVKGYFVRSSIETIELDGGIDGNLAYVDLVGSCYKYDGGYTLTVKLVKDDAEISLLIVTGRVLATSTDTLVVTEDMVSENEMLEKLNAIGNLDDLETVNKTSLVEAINEANRNGGGTGSGGGTVVEEQQLYSGTFNDMVASHHYETPLDFSLTPGVKYDVYINGTKYTVTCEGRPANAMNLIGNKYVINSAEEDTGEPFFIYEKTGTSSDAGKQYLIVSEAGDYEISIYRTVTTSTGSGSGNAQLTDKKILILGDSIGAGNGWEGGFANLIAEDFPGAIVRNAAVEGSCFAGEAIYYQLVLAFQDGFVPDYILFNGGGNDVLNNKTMGTVDLDSYPTDPDTSTTVGGFELLAMNTQKFLPGAKFIYHNLFKLNPSITNFSFEKQRELCSVIKQCCEKYGFIYVDIYNQGNFNPIVEEQFDMFMYDWLHINEAGYRRFWPLIKKALMEA